MKVVFCTNEYPPHVYGGAGVHVEYLSRELARLMEVEVRSFGDQRGGEGPIKARGFKPQGTYRCSEPRFLRAVEALEIGLAMAASLEGADIVHCHTWYSHFAGLVARKLHGVPMVLTTHSLEPSRPWKAEQLGRGYELSSWVEKMAMEQCEGIIAVSEGMKRDVIRLYGVPPEKVAVIHNGIDLEEYRPVATTKALEKHGVEIRRPYVLFVGRVTRQKGIIHLVRAIEWIDEDASVVLCAGAPDTPEIAKEMREAVEEARSYHPRVLWIEQMLPKEELIELYSHAALFCCPSVYEPFGIINVEAMACAIPVVASGVGGIPEIVVPAETGFLVPCEAVSDQVPEPRDPKRFSRDLADKINCLLADEPLRRAFGRAGRRRAEELFSWRGIAQKTVALYQHVVARRSC